MQRLRAKYEIHEWRPGFNGLTLLASYTAPNAYLQGWISLLQLLPTTQLVEHLFLRLLLIEQVFSNKRVGGLLVLCEHVPAVRAEEVSHLG